MAGFQQIKVNRDLEFLGAAAYQPNVKGRMMTEMKIFDEQFVIATTNDWTETEANGVVIAASAVDGGAMTITASNVAVDDCGELSHTAQWSAASNCGMEVKLKISAITSVCVCAGFVDVITATNDRVAMEFNGTALKNNTTTTDMCGFLFDTDYSGTDVWFCVASENGTERTPVAATGTRTPVADTYVKLRVQTNTNGDVDYYYNGIAVGHQEGAIASVSTDLLTPYVGFINRVQGSTLCTVSRITVWQDN